MNKHGELISNESINKQEPLLQDFDYKPIEEMDSASFDDPVAKVSIQRPKLYNRALFLLKIKKERKLSQVAVNDVIGDIFTLLEEKILSLKAMSSSVCRRSMHRQI